MPAFVGTIHFLLLYVCCRKGTAHLLILCMLVSMLNELVHLDTKGSVLFLEYTLKSVVLKCATCLACPVL